MSSIMMEKERLEELAAELAILNSAIIIKEELDLSGKHSIIVLCI